MIGHVGTDPEVRYVEQGVAVARFRFATTEKGYTLQNGTQVPDRTDWHNVILWRRLAEIVERYVHKFDAYSSEPHRQTFCDCVYIVTVTYPEWADVLIHDISDLILTQKYGKNAYLC